MHHAVYAVTGDERFLEDVDDMSTEGLARLIWQSGYWEIPVYYHPTEEKANASVWRALVNRFVFNYSVYEASIDSLKYERTKHSVAIAINLSGCSDAPDVPFAVVSDSGVPDFVHYETFEAFVGSPYAGAYTLSQFYKLPDTYTPEHVWTLDAPHLKEFDWSQHPPAQRHSH